MPEAPESVLIGLRSIRETFQLRWNPTAKRITPGSFDASGVVIPAEWDPRWELWDKDAEGREYMVMQLQTRGGEFRAPGAWLVELMNKLNPARYDGDVSKMIAALVDDPVNRLEEVGDADADDLFEMVARWAYQVRTPKERTMSDARGGQWSATPKEEAACAR